MSDNRYMQGLNDMLEQEFTPADEKLRNSEWMEKNTKLKGFKFSFKKYPFQVALADDQNQNSCCTKPSQVGVSEVYQRLALTMMRRNPHRKLIYAYPDDMMRQKNVQTRVHPLAEQPAFNLEGEAKPIRSIDLVQVGSSFIYMTGSKVGDATSTDADAVFLDEFDLHDMKIASLFNSRTQNSDWKYNRRFSTPTWAMYGIDGAYQNSDKTQYLIRCDSCNKWQYPMFTPEFIEVPNLPSSFNDLLEIDQAKVDHFRLDLAASYVCCKHCRAKLDLGRTDNRSWVTEHPSRTSMMRGWRVNPFSTSTRPPVDLFRDLLDYQRLNNIKGFKNSSLGEPEDTGANRLTEADLRACMGRRDVPEIDKYAPTFMGIDMGHTCHILVGQGYSPKSMKVVRALRMPIGQLMEFVLAMKDTYNLVGAACDRHPESLAAENMRAATNGILVPCEYRGQKEVNLVKAADTKEIVYAQVNRTQILDVAAAQIRNKYIEFNGYEMLEAEIMVHYRNMIRDESPEKEATWVKLDNNDHFFHAAAFLAAAMRIKEFADAVDGMPGVVVAVAGADIAGYNGALVGSSPNQKSKWQPLHLS